MEEIIKSLIYNPAINYAGIYFAISIAVMSFIAICAVVAIVKAALKDSSPELLENPRYVVHSMPIDCVNQKRMCQTCNIDQDERDIAGCPLLR